MAFRDDAKDRVQQATDLVRLISEQVSLKPKGREFVGLCPFHDDKNPSFSVSPAKQIYKCFSCGAGGDAFSFVMNYHKMTFPEAIQHLAQRAGIEIEEERGSGNHGGRAAAKSEREAITQANDHALAYFRAMLKSDAGREARDYIDRRGIAPEMVALFQIGYAPDDWEGLLHAAQRKGWRLDALLKAELVLPRKSGSGHFDFFRHRLIFPILDALGRPVAFGGRKLREEDDPKYLNSRETAVFHKSRTFYGLHAAKKPIIDARTAVIVEGYTDVIACHQAGFANVVATLGTALTAEHVAELRKFAQKVVCLFDADDAGEKAADRAVEIFLTGDVDVAIATLPRGPGGAKMDPAELFSLEEGPELWRQAIGEAKDALSYQFDRVRQRIDAAETLTGRQQEIQAYLAQLAQRGLSRAGSLRRTLVIQRLAMLLRMTEAQVDELLRNATPRTRPLPVAPSNPTGAGGVESGGAGTENVSRPRVAPAQTESRFRAVELAEQQMIGCLLRENALFTQALPGGLALDEAIAPTDMVGPVTSRLYHRLYEALAEGQPLTLASFLGDLASRGETDLAAAVTDADAEVERALAGRGEVTLESLFHAAADRWLAVRSQRQFDLEKSRMLDRARTADDDLAHAKLWERTREHLTASASPVRILRVRH